MSVHLEIAVIPCKIA